MKKDFVYYQGLEKQIEELKKKEEKRKQNITKAIRERRKKGLKVGRPIKPRPAQYQEVVNMYLNKEILQKEACQRLHVNRVTLLKWIKEDQQL